LSFSISAEKLTDTIENRTTTMISRIDHVSIAVRDYDRALAFFQNLLGAIPGASAESSNKKFYWQIFSLGDLSRIEILTPTGDGGLLGTFLENREGGVHHITLETPDIREAMRILDVNNIPYFGFNEYEGEYWKEIFIHPKNGFGVLIQISEFSPDDWLSEEVKFPAGRRWSVEKSQEGCSLTLAHPGGGKVSIDLKREEILNLIKDIESVL
jgi:methylmalonyl-CoA/ethylmalonyl-CoA epimerase